MEFIRFYVESAMYRRADINRIAIEKSYLMFGPVICLLVVASQNIVTLRNRVDPCTRREHFISKKIYTGRAQAFVVIKAENPVVLTLCNRKSPRILNNR